MGTARREQPPRSLRDTDLLDKARRAANGYGFGRLFDHGAWQGLYPSESEADLALCNYLAFWTGGDTDRMDRLFRQSALFDEKWEERVDYRRRTMELAIASINSTYNPGYYRKRRNTL
jgi:primase-polymerase (primpol)-like protein